MQINIIDFGAAHLPERKHFDDFGADVYSTISGTVAPQQMIDIPLGFGLEVPFGYGGYIEPRGSIGKKGLLPVSNPVDSGYRGEIHAVMWNVSDEPIEVAVGDRVAQLVIRSGAVVEFRRIRPDEATDTERGTGCYGSTGR